ncbi:MAG: hypothetical protein IKH53_02260 [Muribaculaceae bacterium]|nr:hypothetical protein [Muribaculaceae bacterium]
MKKMKLWALAAIMCCSAVNLTSCHNNDGREQGVAEIADENRQGDCMTVIDDYLTDSIAPHYAPGEVSIPCIQVVELDQSHPDDSVVVWGDFWVFNYNVVGDTLKMVSGGAHPGKMTVKPSSERGLVVTAFDRVGDGSNYLPSAKRIFGDKYDAFQAIYSNAEKREEFRAAQIADYVKAHELPVKYYQDYGWPAKEIPAL